MDKYTNGDAADIILNEGVEYAVRHYTSGDSFEDPKTAELWDKAAAGLSELLNYLSKQTGREVGYE